MRRQVCEEEAALTAGQRGLVEGQRAFVLDGDSSSEIDARGQSGCNLFARRQQTAFVILPPHCGGIVMDKVITCPCGFVLRGSSDDDVVKKAQEHAKSVHA